MSCARIIAFSTTRRVVCRSPQTAACCSGSRCRSRTPRRCCPILRRSRPDPLIAAGRHRRQRSSHRRLDKLELTAAGRDDVDAAGPGWRCAHGCAPRGRQRAVYAPVTATCCSPRPGPQVALPVGELPPIALSIVEKIVFGSDHVTSLLKDRMLAPIEAMFSDDRVGDGACRRWTSSATSPPVVSPGCCWGWSRRPPDDRRRLGAPLTATSPPESGGPAGSHGMREILAAARSPSCCLRPPRRPRRRPRPQRAWQFKEAQPAASGAEFHR